MSGAVPGRGLSLYPTEAPGRLVELTRLAESLGYENVWFGDSQNLWREAYTCMAAAAAGTSSIVIGTGVTNGVTRHRSVVASSWATLAELSHGRVAAGFGVGDSALYTMGRRPMKVDELRTVLGDLRALWHRKEVAGEQAGSAYRLAYLERPLDIPVYVAASGPRLLDLAGHVADGVILLVGTADQTVRDALASVDAAARSAGRDPADIHVVLWTPVAVDREASAARDRVRAHVARTVLRPIRANLSPAEEEAVAHLREQYDYDAHMVPEAPHARLVPDSLVDRFALAGTRDDCASRARALGELGVDQVAMIPFPGPDQGLEAALHDFAEVLDTRPQVSRTT